MAAQVSSQLGCPVFWASLSSPLSSALHKAVGVILPRHKSAYGNSHGLRISLAWNHSGSRNNNSSNNNDRVIADVERAPLTACQACFPKRGCCLLFSSHNSWEGRWQRRGWRVGKVRSLVTVTRLASQAATRRQVQVLLTSEPVFSTAIPFGLNEWLEKSVVSAK